MSQNVVNYGSDPNGAQLLDDLLALDQQNRLTSDSGASRPNYALIGTRWIEKTSNVLWKLKMFNGTDDIVLCTFNPQADSTTTVAKALLASGAEGALATTLASKAPLNSPVFTGLPTTPTPASDATGLEVVNAAWVLSKAGGAGGEIGDMGFAPLGIDESLNLRRYLNGQVISQDLSPSFTNKVKEAIALRPSLGTTEANWQAEITNSKLGQCGKFVIDDAAGTIRLPCVVNAQGLLGLSGIGNLVNERLPNITGENLVQAQNTSGCFYGLQNATVITAAGSGTNWGTAFDASRSSSTYQNNAPVQQEAVQYPYYIQVATGVEETLPAIREYEINTPFFFGQSMYSDVAPDNASWLASNGQYNARSVYPDYYDWLVEQMNAGVSGFVASTATYTDYDFVINQNNQTFRLPLLNGDENWVGNTSQTLSTADIVLGTPFTWTATKNGFVNFTCYKQNTTQVVIARINGQTLIHSGVATTTTTPRPGFWLKVRKGDTISISAETQTLSGVSITFIPAVGNGTLYYYVGDTVQDASLINAGAVLGQLSNKADIDASNFNADGKSFLSGLGMPSDRYIDLTLGASGATYTAPANGYILFGKAGTAEGQVLQITANGKVLANLPCVYAGHIPIAFVPISKGTVFQISYTVGGNINSFRFIYAEGEN